MSEELRKSLHELVDRKLLGYKQIVLEAYELGETRVTDVRDKEDLVWSKKCRDLAGAGILQFCEKTYATSRWHGKMYSFADIYKLTDKGRKIAEKLITERNSFPSTLGLGFRAPDDIIVLNEPKPKPEEIRDLT